MQSLAVRRLRWRVRLGPGAVLLALLLAACSGPPYPHGSLMDLYPRPPRPQLLTVTVQGHTLQYALMPGAGGTPILFVHGSPGDWKAWARYLDLPALSAFGERIAVDRPGYGGSGAGAVMPDLRAQAQLLAALLPDGAPAVIVGHSLGGPLAAWIAIDHPEKVCGVVMVAGSIDSELEAPRWYNRLAQTWLAQYLAPREMLWSNEEMLTLQTQLQRLDQAWPQLQRPLVMVQGERDGLVDPRSVDYLQQRVSSSLLQVIRVPDQGHFLLWERPAIVSDAIRSLPCNTAHQGADSVAKQ